MAEPNADQTGGATATATTKREPDRAVGALFCIDDGYTLKGLLKDDEKPELRKRPTVDIWFRPALPEVVFDHQMSIAKTANGAERMAIKKALIESHLVKWDGVWKRRSPLSLGEPGEPVHVDFKPSSAKEKGSLDDPSVRRGLGADYIDQIVGYILMYEPGMWETDEKNS